MTEPKKLGLWMTTALVVGNIVGAGVFLLPASLADLGWSGVFGWGVTLTGAVCLAAVFARLSRALPNAGGAFGYMRLGLGDGAAFLGAWGYLVSCWVANAAIAIGGVAYLTRLFPAIDQTPGLTTAVTLGVIWLFTGINLLGSHAAGRTQVVTTLIKLVPFAAVLGLGAWRLATQGASVLAPLAPGSLSVHAVTAAASLTLYSMLGIESATVPADRVENPEVTVPRATLLGTWITGLLSMLACSLIALMIPAATLAKSNAPFSDFVAGTFAGAGDVIAFCAVVSAFGCLSGFVLLIGELPAAMADAGRLPAWWGVRNAWDAPSRSLIVGGVLTSLLVLANASKTMGAAFTFAILLSTATNIVLYVLCAISALRFMRNGTMPASRRLTVYSVIALLFSAWAMYGSGWESIAWGTVLIAAGYPLFAWTRRRRLVTAPPLARTPAA